MRETCGGVFLFIFQLVIFYSFWDIVPMTWRPHAGSSQFLLFIFPLPFVSAASFAVMFSHSSARVAWKSSTLHSMFFFCLFFEMKHLLPTCHMWRSNERVSSLREPPLYFLCSILVYSTQNDCGVCWLFCKWCKCGGLARTRLSCTLFLFKHPTSSRITHICHRTFLKSQGECTSQS